MILNTLLAIKMLKIRPSCIFLFKISTYRRDFGKTKCIYFLMKDEKLLRI